MTIHIFLILLSWDLIQRVMIATSKTRIKVTETCSPVEVAGELDDMQYSDDDNGDSFSLSVKEDIIK